MHNAKKDQVEVENGSNTVESTKLPYRPSVAENEVEVASFPGRLPLHFLNHICDL